MHVFDHTIKPILLYGCEIWGTFNTFSAKFRYGMQNLSFYQIYCKQKAELLHQKFCKYTKNQQILLFYQNLVDFLFILVSLKQ